MSIELVLIPLAIGIVQVVSDKRQTTLDGNNHYSIPTVIKDESMLKQALNNYGADIGLYDNQLKSTVADVDILFNKDDDQQYIALFDQSIERKDAEEFIENIQIEYTSIVRKDTYEKVIRRAKDYGMELESEEENLDRGIVLTFKVTS
ncbi:hypothetical protein GLW07_21900 [Bacillus hwajinpoensis]|uniref:DUF1257 domain-containing protein n=1 Tax=Guptibacillus hwajinpoensis TaxID=208199 RepID=A0A845F5P7_9BACL|nr:hypothetical protein [Pseudalkalibacillus hwajinpoensis]MYL65996.1 hypothetical protein [Pseudalkalibacillus hwajinpoensis]